MAALFTFETMVQYCNNCAAELVPGQRFCRYCGASTDELADDAPTRMMPQSGQAQGAKTAPAYQQQTGRVESHTAPELRRPAPMPVPRGYRPTRSGSWGWIIALVAICLFGLGFLGILIYSKSMRQVSTSGQEIAQEASESTLESGGFVAGADEIVINRRIAIASGSSVKLRNINGDITIETWDKPEAEVRVVKRGGTTADRERVKVYFASGEDSLSLRTSSSRASVIVHYELKLPSSLRLLDISSTNSNVKVSNVTGGIEVDVKNGGIELLNIAGRAETRTINGNTLVVFESLGGEESMEFDSTNGSIEVAFKTPISADVKARTTHGQVIVDDEFGLAVERKIPGQSAEGRIGVGGLSLSLRTKNGNIKLTKLVEEEAREGQKETK